MRLVASDVLKVFDPRANVKHYFAIIVIISHDNRGKAMRGHIEGGTPFLPSPFSLPESAGNWRGNCGGDLARHGSAAQAVDSVCPGAALGLMGLVVRDRGAVEEETTFSPLFAPDVFP